MGILVVIPCLKQKVCARLAPFVFLLFSFLPVLPLAAQSPPAISAQPVSQAAMVGSNATFAATPSGTPPFSYQWRFNTTDIAGATNSSITLTNVQSTNVGPYRAIITNLYGAITSSPATLSLAITPDFLWARSATNWRGTNAVYSVVSAAASALVDPSGNLFVSGYFDGASIDFGGGFLTNSNSSDRGYFISKYDASGNFLWARPAGIYNTADYPPVQTAVDSMGNVVIAAYFDHPSSFGSNVLVTAGPAIFLAKFDPDGLVLWARQIAAYPTNFLDSMAFGMAVGPNDDVFLSSRYSGIAGFGSVTLTNGTAFIARFDASGNLNWARNSLGCDAMVVGEGGAIYLAGSFHGPGFLAKYDNSGNLVWSRDFPHVAAIALDASENIYTTGYGPNGTYGTSGTNVFAPGTFDGVVLTNSGGMHDIFIGKCNSDGAVLWLRQLGSLHWEAGRALALDEFSNIYVSGFAEQGIREPSLSFGSVTLSNVMSFVAKYDAAGNPLWGKSVTGSGALGQIGRTDPSALAVASPTGLYLAGGFSYTLPLGNFSLIETQGFSSTMFVTKLTGMEPPAAPRITGQPQNQNVPASAKVTFSVTVPSGIPLTYQWFFNTTNTIPGATNNPFTLSHAHPSDAGKYSVSVSNAYGATSSVPANLTVYTPASMPLLSPSLAAGYQIQFTVSGVTGATYVIQASTNLLDWVPLKTNTAPFLFMDPTSPTFPQRYYRSVLLLD